MSGDQLLEIRERLGFSRVQMGRVLGYGGQDLTVQACIYRLENGGRTVPVPMARLAILLAASPATRKFARKWARNPTPR